MSLAGSHLPVFYCCLTDRERLSRRLSQYCDRVSMRSAVSQKSPKLRRQKQLKRLKGDC